MALKDTTKKIQEAVGASADGIYGKNTALKIISKLGFTKEELTKIIQKKTDFLSLLVIEKMQIVILC